MAIFSVMPLDEKLPRDLISLRDAVRLAGTKRSRVYRAAATGLLPTYPAPADARPGRGRPRYVSRAELLVLAAAHAFESAQARRERLIRELAARRS